MALAHVDITTSQKLDRSVFHPDIIQSTTKPAVGDNLDRTLHLSTLDTEKTKSRKRINYFKNGNLPTISDSDEIQITEENENEDTNCSDDNKNQQIDTKEDIQKQDSDASFDFSSDYVRSSTHSATNSSSTSHNNRNAMFLTVIGAGLIALVI